MLVARRYNPDEWNTEVMPRVTSGEITETVPAGFLMYGQLFRSVLTEKDGTKFLCVGWCMSASGDPPYVQVSQFSQS